ncbi:MAG TPA: RnfABCDGE type electron transport complex subunit G [bacterium]|nr:RnfABCDGE type electron transport complex subunit G [bacterium]HPN32208.1 RnfABCDGE type electron transport complex subunit G [bacterium]
MKPIIVLTVICLISGFSLAYVNKITFPKRTENANLVLENAKKEVLSQEIISNLSEIKELASEAGVKFYNVSDKQGNRIALIAEFAGKGYAGDIKLLAGISLDNKILGLKPLAHNETPGLGAKITEINENLSNKLKEKNNNIDIKKPWFCEQFKGISADLIKLKKDGGAIDAITASTISSRAVTEAVNKVLKISLNLNVSGK